MADYSKIKRGKRADLGDIHFRSSWEANVARWLTWRVGQGELQSWQFEPEMFVFSGVSHGTTRYLPDFKLTYADGSVEWLEVKGRETAKDRVKWTRFRKHFPMLKLVVIDKPIYKSISSRFGDLPHWEK